MSRVGDMLYGRDGHLRWRHITEALEAERAKSDAATDETENAPDVGAERDLDLDKASTSATCRTTPRNPWKITPLGDTKPGAGNAEDSAPLAWITPPGDDADGAS